MAYYDFDDEPAVAGTQTDYVAATFMPIRIGFGGDYLVHPNFAVGTEFGVRAAVLLSSSSSGAADPDVGFSYQALYGGVRLTVGFGRQDAAPE